jgi:hypothetical protein
MGAGLLIALVLEYSKGSLKLMSLLTLNNFKQSIRKGIFHHWWKAEIINLTLVAIMSLRQPYSALQSEIAKISFVLAIIHFVMLGVHILWVALYF